MCDQQGLAELRPGSNVWTPITSPLVVSGTNVNTSPQGCLASCQATARAAFGDLSWVASGNGNTCPCGGIFLWIDEWIGAAPKAETWDRVTLSSSTLPNGTPAQIQVTMTFLGGGFVNDENPYYTQQARIIIGSEDRSLSQPGSITFVVNAVVGQSLDLQTRLLNTMMARSLQGGGNRSATIGANLRVLTDVTVLTPGVVGATCGSAPCRADLDNGSGSGSPDGAVDINDLVYFLVRFESGHVAVDLDNGSGSGTPDGGVDVNDWLFFLLRFEAGC
jgi:hypothetical protein